MNAQIKKYGSIRIRGRLVVKYSVCWQYAVHFVIKSELDDKTLQKIIIQAKELAIKYNKKIICFDFSKNLENFHLVDYYLSIFSERGFERDIIIKGEFETFSLVIRAFDC